MFLLYALYNIVFKLSRTTALTQLILSHTFRLNKNAENKILFILTYVHAVVWDRFCWGSTITQRIETDLKIIVMISLKIGGV